MSKNVRIRDFRIFEYLAIGGMSRVNSFAGLNGSGKTNPIETLFLLAGGGNPQLAVNANVITWRFSICEVRNGAMKYSGNPCSSAWISPKLLKYPEFESRRIHFMLGAAIGGMLAAAATIEFP